jgi:hypothetical protein
VAHNRGEVTRLWIFAMYFLAIFAGFYIKSRKSNLVFASAILTIILQRMATILAIAFQIP